MKQTVRYVSLTIAGKLRTEIRITVDDARGPEFNSNNNGDSYQSISLFPIVSVNLTKPAETDENGNRVRGTWNPNDSLGMTKYQLPIFINELRSIQEALKIPAMYKYTGGNGKRLELNEEEAGKARRVFLIGNITLELSAVVIAQLDESRVEGIKMKFNNEQSAVLLTLNELDALLFDLKTMDVNSVALLMYLNYISKPDRPKYFDASTITPKVDILPIP